MKKLKIEDLQVESFRTVADPDPQRGTVRGHETEAFTCDPNAPTLCGPGCGWSQLGQNCHPATGTCNPTVEGQSCNWTCNFRECNSGYDATCEGYACMGDSNDIVMC